jgi:hypothetical protein
MNQAVELILKRMESHPEEFEIPYIYQEGFLASSKWGWMIDRITNRLERPHEDGRYNPLAFLTDEEAALIYGKFMEIQEGVFTRAVMHTIMDKSEEEKSEQRFLPTWNTINNTPVGAAAPIPTPPKVTYNLANQIYEVTYPNGFTQGFPEKELEDAPDSVKDLVNSLLIKP